MAVSCRNSATRSSQAAARAPATATTSTSPGAASPANNYGQTKAVAALITGIAQDKGYLDIDAPIGTYLPPDLGDAAHRSVTLRNLLQEASGIQVNNVRGLNFYADNSRPREFFVMDFDYEPGTYFEYDEVGPSVITYVVQHAIWRHEPGVDFQKFAQRELFDELGIPTSSYFWQRDRAGNTEGYSQASCGSPTASTTASGSSPRGSCVSSGRRRGPTAGSGSWSGSTVAGPGCRRRTSTSRSAASSPVCHGWPARRDMAFTVGLGTRTFVIPSLDLVVTRNGEVELATVPSATMLNTDGGGRQAHGRGGYPRVLPPVDGCGD